MSETKCLHRLGTENESTNNLPLNTGQTYYIKVYNKSVNQNNPAGNFKFHITNTQDKEGDTKESSYKIPLNEKMSATMDGNADIDYFKVNMKNESNIILAARNVTISTHPDPLTNSFM